MMCEYCGAEWLIDKLDPDSSFGGRTTRSSGCVKTVVPTLLRRWTAPTFAFRAGGPDQEHGEHQQRVEHHDDMMHIVVASMLERMIQDRWSAKRDFSVATLTDEATYGRLFAAVEKSMACRFLTGWQPYFLGRGPFTGDAIKAGESFRANTLSSSLQNTLHTATF